MTERLRTSVVRDRDVCLRLGREAEARREAARPVREVGNGQLALAAAPLSIRAACKVEVGGRHQIFLFDGGVGPDAKRLFSMSVPDARVLLAALASALDGPAGRGIEVSGLGG